MGLISRLLGQGKAQPAEKKPDRRFHPRYTLEEMTTQRVCDLLEIQGIKGPMAALVHCRQMVCNWVAKVGEGGVEERRDLVLRDLKNIEGLYVME